MSGWLATGVGNLGGLDSHQVIDLIDHPSDGRGVFQFADLFALQKAQAIEDFALMAISLGAAAAETNGNLSHL